MKSKYLFVLAEVLLIAGLVLIFRNFHGSFTMTGAAPIAGSGLELSGSAHGATPFAGMVTVVLSVVAFLGAVIKAFVFESGK